MSKYIRDIPLLQLLVGSLRYKSKSGPKCKPKGPSRGKKPAEEPPSSASTWRLISIGVVTVVSIAAGFMFATVKEHERPKFIPYTYLRLRHKRFAWGDGNHSLFHNPKTNPLPEGYEDEIEKAKQEKLEKERLEEEAKNKGKSKAKEPPKEPPKEETDKKAKENEAKLAKENEAKEKAAKDKEAKELKEKEAKEKAAKEKEAKELKEKEAKEKAAKEKEAKEKAA